MWYLLNKNAYFCSMLQFENQKIKQIVRKVLPVVTLGAMLYSCASIGRPDGGPYDETPPRFIGSTPEAGALNNKRTKVSIEAINIRDYSKDKHNHVDDAPYGGGAGMVMQAAPVYRCYQAIDQEYALKEKKTRV